VLDSRVVGHGCGGTTTPLPLGPGVPVTAAERVPELDAASTDLIGLKAFQRLVDPARRQQAGQAVRHPRTGLGHGGRRGPSLNRLRLLAGHEVPFSARRPRRVTPTSHKDRTDPRMRGRRLAAAELVAGSRIPQHFRAAHSSTRRPTSSGSAVSTPRPMLASHGARGRAPARRASRRVRSPHAHSRSNASTVRCGAPTSSPTMSPPHPRRSPIAAYHSSSSGSSPAAIASAVAEAAPDLA
jgi:hypothetical protein